MDQDYEALRWAVADKLAELLRDDEAGWSAAARWLESRALENGFDTAARFESVEIFAHSFMDSMRFHSDLRQRFPGGERDLDRFEIAEELFWHILPH